MTFKASTPPLCRYCGKPIPKATERRYHFSHANPPRTREEAQRTVNQPIVAIRYEERIGLGRYVSDFSTWDGESYVDEFFCTGAHARLFAYAAARGGQVMSAYLVAKAQRQERAAS